MAASQPGWAVDNSNQQGQDLVLPKEVAADAGAEPRPSEERLAQLTDYIAYLEK